jgi:hypothetical protein
VNEAKEQRRADRYKCATCGLSIVVYVRIAENPKCNNHSVHSGRTISMQLLTEEVQKGA